MGCGASATLQTKVEQLEKSRSLAKQQAATADEEVESLRGQLAQSKEQVLSLEAKLEQQCQARDELAETKRLHIILKAQLEGEQRAQWTIADQLQKSHELATQRQQDFEQSLRQHELATQRLEKSLKERLAQSKQQVLGLEANVGQLCHDRDQLTKELTEEKEAHGKLCHDRDHLVKELSEEKGARGKLCHDRDQLAKELTEEKEACGKLMAEVHEERQRFRRKSEEADLLCIELEKVNELAVKHQLDLAPLRANLEITQTRGRHLSEQLLRSRDDHKSASDSFAALQLREQELVTKVDELQVQLREQDAAHKGEAQTWRAESVENLRRAKEEGKASLETVIKQQNELETEITRFRQRLCVTETQLAEARADGERSQRELSGTQEELNSARSASTQLETQVADLESSLVGIRAELRSWQEKAKRGEKELEKSKAECQSLQHAITQRDDRFGAALAVLESKSCSIQDQMAIYRLEEDKLKAKVRELQKQLQVAETKKQELREAFFQYEEAEAEQKWSEMISRNKGAKSADADTNDILVQLEPDSQTNYYPWG